MLTIEVTAVAMYASHRISDRAHPLRPGCHGWLQLRGTTDEPIKGQSDVEISVHQAAEDGSAPNTNNSIGALIQIKPGAHIVLDIPPALFDRVWAMASGEQLRHLWLSMRKPQRNKAIVLSVLFQNQPIE